MWSANAPTPSFGVVQLIGYIIMMIVNGLNSMAGLGGGGTNVVILIFFFSMPPKHATIVVFACIFGASFGNMINQMRRSLNGQPAINYRYASITIPLMFAGAIFGVMINQYLPTIVVAVIIIGVNVMKLPSIIAKFKAEYQKESSIISKDNEYHSHSIEAIEQTKINPFNDRDTVMVFEQLIILIVIYVILEFLKGSFRFRSILGIRMCSLTYWIMEGLILLVAMAFFQNSLNTYKQLNAPASLDDEEERMSVFDDNNSKLITNSAFAGVLSGLGLGGGIILVPLYNELGLSPVHASSTSGFTVFVASGINVIQALFIGAMGLEQFFLFFLVSAIGSYFISTYCGQKLRKMNRTSIIELILLISTLVLLICYPYSLYYKFELTGGRAEIIFGFGTMC